MDALRTAATGMLAQQHNVEVIANNLANMNTSGYQRRRTEFNDLIYRNAVRDDTRGSRAEGPVPGVVTQGMGVQVSEVYRIHEQGELKATDNLFNVAIRGNGFFQIAQPDGTTAYTRNGTFQIDQTGRLVSADGRPVEPNISIPDDAVDVLINANGEVSIRLDGEPAPVVAGQIQLATFPNPGGLRALGNSLLAETTASGPAATGIPNTPGYGQILQGFLENSNVNPVEEISRMIEAHRIYQLNSKMIQTADQMMASRR